MDSKKAAFFFSVIPEAFKPITFREIFLDFDLSPVAESILVPPKSLCTHSLNRWVGLVLSEPFCRALSVKVSIVVSLEWEPSTYSFLRVSKLHALFK
jgi:hypothetical protein